MDKTIETRRVHTKLFTDIAKDAIDSVFGQLSDGFWENSRRMEQYWQFAHVERDLNGEVVIVVDKITGKIHGSNCKWTSNAFAEMTDNQVLEFLGKKLREIANIEFKDKDLKPDHSSQRTMEYLTRNTPITAEMTYVLADILLGKSVDCKAFILQRLIGQARSVDEIAHQQELRNKLLEAENKRVNKNAAAQAAYEKAVAEAKKAYDMAYADAWNEFKVTRKALLDDGLVM